MFPKKRFGQNFLTDPHIIERILEAFAPLPGQKIVEIGPGRGALTAGLIERASPITAIEIDRDLVAQLSKRYPSDAITLIEQDALQYAFTSTTPDAKLRIIGNLPYNISTPLLVHLFDYQGHWTDMMFMLQKEVADRLLAQPDSKEYGRLSLLAQLHCDMHRVVSVSPGAFYPVPKVHSTVVAFRPKPLPLPVHHLPTFERLVFLSFNQRRKTLRNALKSLCHEDILRAVGVDPQARAETLPLAVFVQLANHLYVENNK